MPEARPAFLYGFCVRVCIVTRVLPVHGIGGMQDHTIDLVRGLVAAGHEVDVITSRHPEGLEEEEVDGARRHYVDAPMDDFTNGDWRNGSYEAFRRLDEVEPFDVVHSEGSSALELARRGVQQTTPFVVMFHGNFLGLVKASLGRQLRARRPLAVLREQRGLTVLARRHFAKGNWRVFHDCEAIVPSSQQVADTCRSHRLDLVRVHVVPNGVDVATFRPRPRAEIRHALGLGLPKNGFLFVCAGRLSREKGTHHALDALAIRRERMPDARLLIVGDGSERGPLENQASRLGLQDRVLFAGAQPSDKMPDFLASADVFLFPTERDEAAPLILPQAMACGLPVIASKRGGIDEVIDRPGANGILVPPGDVRALAEAAMGLYDDEALRVRLAEGALTRVRDAYTLQRMVASTVAVYEIARDRSRCREG
jgi:glycosyltransferase involved in cell wall biosynthesis